LDAMAILKVFNKKKSFYIIEDIYKNHPNKIVKSAAFNFLNDV